jgi:hypothetical protein
LQQVAVRSVNRKFFANIPGSGFIVFITVPPPPPPYSNRLPPSLIRIIMQSNSVYRHL